MSSRAAAAVLCSWADLRLLARHATSGSTAPSKMTCMQAVLPWCPCPYLDATTYCPDPHS